MESGLQSKLVACNARNRPFLKTSKKEEQAAQDEARGQIAQKSQGCLQGVITKSCRLSRNHCDHRVGFPTSLQLTE